MLKFNRTISFLEHGESFYSFEQYLVKLLRHPMLKMGKTDFIILRQQFKKLNCQDESKQV